MVDREDIKRIFYDDIKEKKAVGRGSYHKKNGSKSKRVPCSTDHMSQREWEKMNSAVKTYDLNSPMPWDAFCGLPDDLKDQYIRALASRFGATKQALCEVFGTNIRAFDKAVSNCDFKDVFTLGRRITAQGKADLLAFFKIEKSKEEQTTDINLCHVTLEFKGAFHASQISDVLRRFLNEGQKVSLHINCDIIGEKE